MNKFAAAVALFAIILTSACSKEQKKSFYNNDGTPITQEQALKIAKKEIDSYDVVYISQSILEKGKTFVTSLSFGKESIVPYDSWILMIDSDPLANGGQKWLYIYIDAYYGTMDTVSWEWGLPISFNFDSVKYVMDSYTIDGYGYIPSGTATRTAQPVSKNWAVIISGGANPYSNYERYWNDCSALYKSLRQVYNYSPERIFTIMSDGKSSALDRRMNNGTYSSSPQDLDGDGTDDINYAATRSNISTVFDYLKSNVKDNEQLIIFVTDHGGTQNGESYINLWNEEIISASSFAEEVSKINSRTKKHVVLGQCYSGGFVSPLSSLCSNITVSTASAADEVSYAMSNKLYDNFLYHWISAASGQTPEKVTVNAESNGFEGITAEEMFIYSEKKRFNKETPQYISVPQLIGKQYGLSGEKFPYLILTGPRHMSSTPNSSYVFELSGLPETCSTKWLSSSDIRFYPTSDTSAYASNVSSIPIKRVNAEVKVTTQTRTYTATATVSLWKPGTYLTTNLISGSIEEGYFSLPYNVEGAEEYYWNIECPDYTDLQSNSYFVDFHYTGNGAHSPYYVSVRFNNPLGEQMIIVRHYE